ncbi:MAG: hypothetical protein CM1200mP10_25280 [Candidatus Neomarinimicrobiota bacterium]|nr:MAG: hypothetical protein CM1200mP10_25280 [Candidatus Neomarinimicrobiota bacterium]
MTLTAPGCGMGPVIADEVKQKVKGSLVLEILNWILYGIRHGTSL